MSVKPGRTSFSTQAYPVVVVISVPLPCTDPLIAGLALRATAGPPAIDATSVLR